MTCWEQAEPDSSPRLPNESQALSLGVGQTPAGGRLMHIEEGLDAIRKATGVTGDFRQKNVRVGLFKVNMQGDGRTRRDQINLSLKAPERTSLEVIGAVWGVARAHLSPAPRPGRHSPT